MFPGEYIISNAKNVAIILHCRVSGISFELLPLTRLSLSVNFFVASLVLSVSLNNIK